MTKPLTHDQARAQLSHQGISIAQWAREHGYNYSIVLEVLAGRKKCGFGTSHNIAVALGMKQGVATSRPGRELHRAGQQPRQHAGAAA